MRKQLEIREMIKIYIHPGFENYKPSNILLSVW